MDTGVTKEVKAIILSAVGVMGEIVVVADMGEDFLTLNKKDEITSSLELIFMRKIII